MQNVLTYWSTRIAYISSAIEQLDTINQFNVQLCVISCIRFSCGKHELQHSKVNSSLGNIENTVFVDVAYEHIPSDDSNSDSTTSNSDSKAY